MLFKNYKRCLSFALAWVLVISLMPVSALAANAEENPAEETAITEPMETTAPATEAPTEPEVPLISQIRSEIDAYVTHYGLTADMTDTQLAQTYFAIEEAEPLVLTWADRIFAAMQELSEEDLDILAAEETTNLFFRFCDVVEKINTPQAIATTVKPTDGLEITDSVGTGSVSGTTYTVTATGGTTSRTTNNISITNTSGVTKELSFDYALTGKYNSYTLPNSKTSGSVTAVLQANGSLSYSFESQALKRTATLTFTNISYKDVAASSNVTVTYSSLGSVKIDGTTVASGSVNSISSATGSSFVAVPGSGNKFIAWINPTTNAVISTSTTYQLLPTEDMSIRAVFASASTEPCFWANGSELLFESYDAAITHASSASNKVITLAEDGTLPAGDYTIPAGVTLLIPYDSGNTLCTTKPSFHENTYTAPTVYRTLTMASGANITVNGSLSVAGSQSSQYGYNGMPSGPLGFINMQSGSKITVESDANLYAWGYITGSGSVEIKSGGTVYECFQIADYRGGDVTSSMTSKAGTYGVFPFNQYYIQNIEVPMTLHAGATENGAGAVQVTLAGLQEMAIPFIGASDSMFVIDSGYIVKDYIEGTGRTEVQIYGDLNVTEVSIDMKVNLVGSITIDTSKYALPIPHHFTISAESGSINMDQSMAFLPGSELYIREGTTCTLGSLKKIYVYDWDEWIYNNGTNGYSGTSNLPYMKTKYVPGGDGTTGRAKDALVQIDGTVDASAGSVYVTNSGANIYSTGTGVAKVASTTSATAYQVITNGTDISSWPEIAMQPAILQDADGTDVATASKAGTYTYYASTGKWCPPGHRYADVVTAPTCTVAGYTTHSCIACGDSYIDTEVAALGHTEVTDTAVAPTCTQTGLTQGTHCSVCNTVLAEQKTVSALGHSYSNWQLKTPATLTTAAVEVKTCAECGDEQTQTIKSAAINDTEYETLSAALAAAEETYPITTITLKAHYSDAAIPVSKVITIAKGDYSANIAAGDGYATVDNDDNSVTIYKTPFDIVYTNLKVTDSLNIYFYVRICDLLPDANYVAKLTRTYANGSSVTTELALGEWESYDSQLLRFCYSEIAAKEMTDTVTVTVYKDGTEVASTTRSASVQSYAIDALKQFQGSSDYDVKLRTALIDMLNYGASAQTFFGYGGALANKDPDDSTTIQDNLKSASAALTTCQSQIVKGQKFAGVTVSAKNRLMFTFYYNISSTDGMKAELTFGDGTTREIDTFYERIKGSLYGVDVENISFVDARQLMTCKLYKDGTLIDTSTDSIEGYVARNSAEENDVYAQMMKFADSAKAFFNTDLATS